MWLAPPEKQIQMRNAAWWSILWTDPIVEIPHDAPIWFFGEQAIRALNERVSSNTITDWVLDLPVFEGSPERDWLRCAEEFDLFNLAFERFIAGGIIKELIQQHGPNGNSDFPSEPPSDEALELAIRKGRNDGLSALKSKLERDASHLLTVLQNDFQLNLT